MNECYIDVIVSHLVCCLHKGYLHTDERAGTHVTLLTDSRVLGVGLTLTLTHSPFCVERDMGPWFSGSSPDFLCRLWLGGK